MAPGRGSIACSWKDPEQMFSMPTTVQFLRQGADPQLGPPPPPRDSPLLWEQRAFLLSHRESVAPPLKQLLLF